MTDKLAQELEIKENESVGSDSEKVTSARNHRRKLLKSVVAVPVVMTLQSGAALARTSNLIGTVADPNLAARNLEGTRVVCLDPDPSKIEQTDAPPYDLGESPSGYLVEAGPSIKDQADTCLNGGGIIVSADAFASIEGRINFRV